MRAWSPLAVNASYPDQDRWFAEEIQPHESLLRAWLQRRFSTFCDVDDIVQESYLRVMEAAEHGELRSRRPSSSRRPATWRSITCATGTWSGWIP